jgi:hypothetical protein
MNPDRNLAAASERGKGRTLNRDREVRVLIVEKPKRLQGSRIILPGFDSKRSLPSRGAKVLRLKPFPDPLGFLEPVKTGSGQQDRIHLALCKLAQSCVHVAAKLDSFNIGPDCLQLCAAALAAGANTSAGRQLRKAVVPNRDKDIARINARRGGRKGKGLGKLGGQVFERVNGQVDATFGQRFFNFLGEHALRTDLGEGDLLKAVAGGLDDLDFDLVARATEQPRDMVRLP